MCGIFGYIGNQQATDILLQGLEKLEYRGYDSAGIAVRREDQIIETCKASGRLLHLRQKLKKSPLFGTAGIGHTRWATHGEPTETNAHPHFSQNRSVCGVHNGIIENYREIKNQLSERGISFQSQTDTEVCINLLAELYEQADHDALEAMKMLLSKIRGSYALVILFADRPDEIWATRKDSPMIIGHSGKETFFASDVPAMLEHTRSVYYIEDLQIASATRENVQFYDQNGNSVDLPQKEITRNVVVAEKGGFDSFLLKEIHEQPQALENTYRSLVKNHRIDLQASSLNYELLRSISQLHIVACGSAYHVGTVGKYFMEELARVPVSTDFASEFRYRRPLLSRQDLVVIISQSGETADSLAALREAKRQGTQTLAIVNVIGSSIAREADHVIYTMAGPEIAVATTKAYSCQLLVIYLLGLEIARAKERITKKKYRELLDEIALLPGKIQTQLDQTAELQRIAELYKDAGDIFFVGRGIDYSACLEGSLKLKEISYIHSEAYAAGELKHGTISLIEQGTLVLGLLTQPHLYGKTLSNLQEVQSRGGYIVAISNSDDVSIEQSVDSLVSIPESHPLLTASIAIVPLQLLAYFISKARGLDVDKPRNLAKSVTVE